MMRVAGFERVGYKNRRRIAALTRARAPASLKKFTAAPDSARRADEFDESRLGEAAGWHGSRRAPVLSGPARGRPRQPRRSSLVRQKLFSR